MSALHLDVPSVGLATPDFRLLFQAMRACNLALTPDLTIVEASEAYLSAIGARRDQLLGRDVVEALRSLQSWSYVSDLRAALCRVVAQKQAGIMATQRIRQPRSALRGGGFDEVGHQATCSPVFGGDDRLVYLLHCIERVRENGHGSGPPAYR